MTSCCTRIRAFALISFMEYGLVLPSILLSFVTLVFNKDDFTIATRCFAPYRYCVFTFECLLLWLSLIVRLGEEELFEFQPGQKTGCSVDWASDDRSFQIEWQHIITCAPQCWWNCFGLEKTCDQLLVCENDFRFLLFPIENVQTREMPCRLLKIILNRWTIWVVQWRVSLIQTPRGHKSCVLIVLSGPGYRLSCEF